jgi:hypothetical protein
MGQELLVQIHDENLSAVSGMVAAINQWPELRLLSGKETKPIKCYDKE